MAWSEMKPYSCFTGPNARLWYFLNAFPQEGNNSEKESKDNASVLKF